MLIPATIDARSPLREQYAEARAQLVAMGNHPFTPREVREAIIDVTLLFDELVVAVEQLQEQSRCPKT